ncbi:MFS transporter [Variovorax sp. PBL-E5]|uniref:MFS transporter n=1 Tax=Variovorax sp. PBL-E5 TaxID=434014 RepID=UPI001318E4FB|nr:MFS transporter [Variovorax sp. PBL-E5]VTU25262.1 Proline porter II [Variovorax sp. PBL-E5]
MTAAPMPASASVALSVTRAGPSRRKIIAATTAGNALEFFDFTVYGFFAITIGKLFFPSASAYGQLMLSVATFGVGFLMRPVGGVLIGAFADRVGRRAAMVLTMNLMALGCLMIGLAPTYAQAGLIGPTMLVLARLIQGISAGGEVGASATVLIEQADTRNRGFFGSWEFASQGLGIAVGAAVALLLTASLEPAALESWGWRVPFLLGALIAPVGAYLRRHLGETLRHRDGSHSVIATALKSHGTEIWLGSLLSIGNAVAAYTVAFYMPIYAIRELHLPPTTALLAALVSGALSFTVSPFIGRCADMYSRKVLVIIGRIGMLVLIYPAFLWLIASPTQSTLLLAVAGMSLLLAFMNCPSLTLFPEMFPQKVRVTGMSFVIGVSVLFGGFQQLVATWLIENTGSKLSPALYLIVVLVVSSLALIWIKDRTGEALN